ncbi:CTLH/CRA C-terminal to lish motif domain-containing protein [Fomitopsis betulina]|nr:CTLH/CRA C-terminal to lish motif domain-containing protein [Fomitopsis betulina]KAI0736743.1 CTLH/CRA C-terminal to lish motif domain-containing protein [Fomitopsis betulina]
MYWNKSQSKTQSLDATTDELRTLVLDYLCHNASSKTVQAFTRNSAIKYMDADGDEVMVVPDEIVLPATLKARLSSGEYRKEIRSRILAGQIDESIELLNQYFPSVLADNGDALPLGKAGGRLEYIPPTSVNPAHLLINLHIQGFIEAARSVPLPYHPSGNTTPPSPPPPQGDIVDEDKETADQRATERLLHRAQNLYAEANRLPNPAERGQYLLELGKVGSLLAYRIPEDGPVTQYLGQDRREALADSIDSAILYRTGQPVVSKLELAARQTSVVWAMLHAQKVKPPSPSNWPTGVTPPGYMKSATPPSSVPSKKLPESDTPEVFVPFHLQSFLNSSA